MTFILKKIKNKKSKLIIIITIILISCNILSLFNYNLDVLGVTIMNVQKYQEQENLTENTIIIAKKIENNLNVGDLVIINISDSTYFHRVMKIENNHIITKGDGNFKNDNIQFKKEDIQYKVILQIPYLGILIKIIESKMLSVIIFAGLFMYYAYSKGIDKKNLKRRRMKIKNEEK